MNVIDLLSGYKPSEDELSKKLAIKSELQKIETRAGELVKNIFDFVLDETKFIKNGLSYAPNSSSAFQLTDNEKDIIVQKLYNVIKTLSSRIDKEMADIGFDLKGKSEKKEEEKPEEIKNLEVVAVDHCPAPAPDYFGY